MVNATSVGTFEADITRFVQKTGLKADIVVKKLAFDAFSGLLLRSPVDTGRFRGSWRICINNTDLTVEPDRAGKPSAYKGKGGTAPADPGETAAAEGKLGEVKFGQVIYLTNNLPYAEALENGHSKQAPVGVLAVTFADIKNSFASAVLSVIL